MRASIGTDENQFYLFAWYAMRAWDSTVGPGNVFPSGADFATLGIPPQSNSAHIVGNFFGFDPVSNQLVSNGGISIELQGQGTVIERNVFANFDIAIKTMNVFYGLYIRDNLAGVDPTGHLFSSESRGVFLRTALPGTLMLGPGNVITGTEQAAIVQYPSHLTMTIISRNRIFGNESGIVFDNSCTVRCVRPPMINSASTTHVSGTCDVTGIVEVYTGEQGETFLGEVWCGGGGAWRLATHVEAGQSVTANLTRLFGGSSPFSTAVLVGSGDISSAGN